MSLMLIKMTIVKYKPRSPTIHRELPMTLRQLIIKLPPMPMEEDFGETELCSRFVEAFLCGLFGDPDNDTYLRWKNESTLEARSMR